MFKRLKNLWAWSEFDPADYLRLVSLRPIRSNESESSLVNIVDEGPVTPEKPKMAEIIRRHPVDPIEEILKHPDQNELI